MGRTSIKSPRASLVVIKALKGKSPKEVVEKRKEEVSNQKFFRPKTDKNSQNTSNEQIQKVVEKGNTEEEFKSMSTKVEGSSWIKQIDITVK